MSDVGLNFSAPELIVMYLMMGILPLTIVAALCAFWLHRRRNSRVALVVSIIAGLLWLVSAGGWASLGVSSVADNINSSAYQRNHERTLASAQTIGGVRFPAGSVVHDYGVVGTPLEVDLPGPTVLRGVPATGVVQVFADSGLTGELALARDATIDGMRCRANFETAFSNGKLVKCRLALATRIGGIPCSGDIDLSDGVECTLSSPYRESGIRFGAGSHWSRYATFALVTTGPNPPDVRVFGRPLAEGTNVRLDGGSIDIEMTVTSGSCSATDVVFSKGIASVSGGGCKARFPGNAFTFARGGHK